MARFVACGCAGGAGGDADAMRIKREEEHLAVYAVKRYINIIRQTLNWIAVKTRLGQLSDKPIAELGKFFGIRFSVFAGNLKRFGKAYGQFNAFGSGAPAPLLIATENHRGNFHASPHKQTSDPFWSINLRSIECHEINAKFLDIQRQIPCRLTSINMEKRGFSMNFQFPIFNFLFNFLDRLNNSNFIIGIVD